MIEFSNMGWEKEITSVLNFLAILQTDYIGDGKNCHQMDTTNDKSKLNNV